MAYSRSYQQVTAGRVREDEDSFNKNNYVATPARVFSANSVGGKKQPTVDVEHMHDEEMGKRRTVVGGKTKAQRSAYNPGSYNV